MSDNTDRLAYKVRAADGRTLVVVYDPESGTKRLVCTDTNFIECRFSVDGRVAYSSGSEGKAQLYVLDTVSNTSGPINITQNSTASNYPLAWSSDGRYLAFALVHDARHKLVYVWNGKSVTNIMPTNVEDTAHNFQLWWSPNGRYLAFVPYFNNASRRIYVWNGNTVIDITPADLQDTVRYYNVWWSPDGQLVFAVLYRSRIDANEIYLWNDGNIATRIDHNLTGQIQGLIWNSDGQLAFSSRSDGEYDILVCNGISFANEVPTMGKFTKVFPKLTHPYFFPLWAKNDLLSFNTVGPQDNNMQIYVWDGNTAINISQNPTMSNISQTWNADGYWAFGSGKV